MKYKITTSPTFEKDFDNIMAFYIDKNPNYAIKLLKEIEKLIFSLEDFPERFAKIPDIIGNKNFNIRQLVYDNYRIIYQVKDSNVYILTMLGQNLLDPDKLINK